MYEAVFLVMQGTLEVRPQVCSSLPATFYFTFEAVSLSVSPLSRQTTYNV